MIILLDAGPLGLTSNPKASTTSLECYQWIESMVLQGERVLVPEIADYEIRRELIRANKIAGISRLDLIKHTLGYLPLSTSVMLKAAELWAHARQTGKPTADDKSLDCDVILSAQAIEEGAIVVTDNIGHLSRFVEAKHWRDVK